MSGTGTGMRAAFASLATGLLVLLVLHGSPFSPSWLNSLLASVADGWRDGWLQRMLPAEARVFTVLAWAGAVFALLTLLQAVLPKAAALVPKAAALLPKAAALTTKAAALLPKPRR